MPLFLAADACLSWSLPSITEQQVSSHRLPMKYWLKNHRLSSLFEHSPHTNSISNSAILCNNYISLLSDLCACVHVKKKWRRKGSHSSSVSGSNRLVWLQTWKKAMGWCTAQLKMLLFCAKTIVKESRKFEQEHIEPAREHVTAKFKHGCRILILVTSKYGKAATCACKHSCVLRVPWHGPRVNRGFNPIQQQPSHHSRQQRATRPRVPSFWTE